MEKPPKVLNLGQQTTILKGKNQLEGIVLEMVVLQYIAAVTTV